MLSRLSYFLLALLLLHVALETAQAQTADAENDYYYEDEYEADEFEDDDYYDSGGIADPVYYFNKTMYRINDKLYFWVLEPVASGYANVLPEARRVNVRNFFHNLDAPVRIVNCLLQGKALGAGHEIRAFAINTTVGIAGFRDAAGIDYAKEDFGQTLAAYGIGHGCYLVWPVLGPSSLRDTVGRFCDRLVSPLSYAPYVWQLGGRVTNVINDTSSRLGKYERLKEAAFDPYSSIRDIYIQLRAEKVRK